MMTLNEKILGEAKTSRDRLLELQHEAERAQADFQHAVRRLHAAGGSMREIGESLSLSHQRVHQIVDSATPGPAREAREERWGPVHRSRRGVRDAFRRFAKEAQQVVVDAQEEAATLGHRFLGTEHLLLALLRGGGPGTAALGTTYDTARERIVDEVGEGPGSRRGRFRFTPAAKRTLEHALQEAKDLGDRRIGSEHVLLGLLSSRGLGAEILGDPETVRASVLAEIGRA